MIGEIGTRQELADEVHRLLASLDEGEMSESAYDTAWIARLHHPDDPGQPLFPEAYDWLLRHQHEDGSWGGEIPSPHDRVVSTLAALLTLTSVPFRPAESEPAARRAIVYLNREGGKVRDDPAETVGFELLLPEMARQAQAFGLRLPYADWEFVDAIREEKMRRIPPRAIYGGPTPLTHSLEYLGDRLATQLVDRCQLPNGSFGVSPSTTAFVQLQAPDSKAWQYLDRVRAVGPTGGVPYVHPFEVFETSWVLHLLGPLASHAPATPTLLERLRSTWSTSGMAWTAESTVTDADDTAVTLAVLTANGMEIGTDALRQFEVDEYFQTFIWERDASVTTNAHVLYALRRYPSSPERRRMILKTTQFLTSSRHEGGYWHDKWHISPYYATSQVVEALVGLDDTTVRSAAQWVLDQQKEDGSWGWFGDGTEEETAWAMHTLLTASDHDSALKALCVQALRRGRTYLAAHFEGANYPALWIGKTLYTPPNIVRTVILNVLLRTIDFG